MWRIAKNLSITINKNYAITANNFDNPLVQEYFGSKGTTIGLSEDGLFIELTGLDFGTGIMEYAANGQGNHEKFLFSGGTEGKYAGCVMSVHSMFSRTATGILLIDGNNENGFTQFLRERGKDVTDPHALDMRSSPSIGLWSYADYVSSGAGYAVEAATEVAANMAQVVRNGLGM